MSKPNYQRELERKVLMMSYEEMVHLLYQQDSTWANYAQYLQNHGEKSRARKMKNFLDKDWSPIFTRVVEHGPVTDGYHQPGMTAWDSALDEILYHFNTVLYPKAREVGFPQSTFLVPDISLDEKVGVGAPFGSFLDKLKHLLSTKEASELAPFAGLPGIITLDVANDLLASAKSGDPAAVKSLEDIHRDAKKGDPSAKAAVKTLAVVDKAQSKKAEASSMSFYERGVSVGHNWYTIVGDDRDHRKASGGRQGGGVRVTQGANKASRRHTYSVRTPSGALIRYGNEYHGTPGLGALGAAIRQGNFELDHGLNRNVLGRPPTHLSQDTGSGYGDTGIPVPSGTDGMGNVIDQYGNPMDPSQYGGGGGYADLGTPLEDMEGYEDGYGFDPYGFDPYGYDPYADFFNAPMGIQTYDPITDSFYSDTAKQEYDPETDSFYPT